MTLSPERLTRLPDYLDEDLLQAINLGAGLPEAALNALREAAFRRILKDRRWFLENFWMVMDPDTMTWTPFRFRDYQEETEEWIAAGFAIKRSRRIAGKARQVGMTTQVVGSAMWDLMVHSNHPWYVVSQTEGDAQKTLGQRAKQPYMMLPQWLKDRFAQEHDAAQFLRTDNMETLIFANGSRIDSVVSTPNVGRGDVVFGVIMDEAAHQSYPYEVYAALDPLCYGPMFVISTGNGMGNFFHGKWLDSQLSDSEWKAIFHAWWVVPGRDDTWYEREKRKSRDALHLFYQEYPATPEEMFSKTGMTVLPVDLLRERGCWCPPAVKVDLDMGWDNESDDWRVYLGEGEESHNELWIWEKPRIDIDPETGQLLREPNYIIFADVAEGSEHGDRTSIDIFNANTLEQVASYLGHWPVEDLAELLDRLGRWYHLALMAPERNNQGIAPINELYKYLRYPRMFRMTFIAEVQKTDRTPKLGWQTTTSTKPKMVFDFIKAVKDDHIILHDERFLQEASTFIKVKQGYEASSGNHDDKVMSVMGGWQIVQEVGQFPIVWQPTDIWKPVTFGDLERLDREITEGDHQHPLDVGINRNPRRHGMKAFTW